MPHFTRAAQPTAVSAAPPRGALSLAPPLPSLRRSPCCAWPAVPCPQPSNLLLNSECQVKLADFGLARSVAQLNPVDLAHNPILTDYVATRWWVAAAGQPPGRRAAWREGGRGGASRQPSSPA